MSQYNENIKSVYRHMQGIKLVILSISEKFNL
jgi:hypothetical protein